MLIRELGEDAYVEARLLQNRAKSRDERRYWRDVALAVARLTGRRIGLETATRMSRDADFSGRGAAKDMATQPQPVDPVEELKRLIGDRGQTK